MHWMADHACSTACLFAFSEEKKWPARCRASLKRQKSSQPHHPLSSQCSIYLQQHTQCGGHACLNAALLLGKHAPLCQLLPVLAVKRQGPRHCWRPSRCLRWQGPLRSSLSHLGWAPCPCGTCGACCSCWPNHTCCSRCSCCTCGGLACTAEGGARATPAAAAWAAARVERCDGLPLSRLPHRPLAGGLARRTTPV